MFHDDTLARPAATDPTAHGRASGVSPGTDQRIPLLRGAVAGERASAADRGAQEHQTYRALCERTAQLLDDDQPVLHESFDPRIVRWVRLTAWYGARPARRRFPLVYLHAPYQSLASALLTNVRTCPHFAAYRHQDAPQDGLRLFAAGAAGGMTVRSPEDEQRCHRLFGTVIFEYYKPQ